MIHTVKGVVNEAEVDAFLESPCLFNGPTDAGNLISSFSAFSTTNCEKLLKEMETPDHLNTSHETGMQIKKQQLELDMKQQTGSKQEKEYVKAVYCHPACLIYMQSTS